MSSAQNTIPTDSVSGTFVTQEQVAELAKSNQLLQQNNQLLQQQVEALTAQVAWFKQQIFGSKSERRIEPDDTLQLNLFADLE
ncbi:transposase domain-containing protein, partial [Orrella sp. 11846]|uniref:transposase domain-containing protein n=1 Tax=Orrella sp. 11846 TaxID=3409913 RepID=UPI003B5A03A3